MAGRGRQQATPEILMSSRQCQRGAWSGRGVARACRLAPRYSTTGRSHPLRAMAKRSQICHGLRDDRSATGCVRLIGATWKKETLHRLAPNVVAKAWVCSTAELAPSNVPHLARLRHKFVELNVDARGVEKPAAIGPSGPVPHFQE